MISSLLARYKKELRRLQVTGGGLSGNDDVADDSDSNKYLDCYISNTGPDSTTTEEARNLWGRFSIALIISKLTILKDEITKVFPFFPRLH